MGTLRFTDLQTCPTEVLDLTSLWVHYVILTSRPLEDSTVVGWQEKIAQQPTCGGAPDGHGSHYLF
jgi:hypothetical protein